MAAKRRNQLCTVGTKYCLRWWWLRCDWVGVCDDSRPPLRRSDPPIRPSLAKGCVLSTVGCSCDPRIISRLRIVWVAVAIAAGQTRTLPAGFTK